MKRSGAVMHFALSANTFWNDMRSSCEPWPVRIEFGIRQNQMCQIILDAESLFDLFSVLVTWKVDVYH